MKRISLLLVGWLSVFAPLSAQNIKFEEYNLDNGLHVILHQDNSTPIVAVSVLYHVGSKNEDAQRTGFAHFFEHLMFEGSKNIERGDYMKKIQGIGGELNANTTTDRTYYYEIVPSNQLEMALWMESERMLQLKVDSVGVETQRGVVKEERNSRYDNRPYGRVSEEIFKRIFKVHPYRWTPIGSAQYINQSTLAEFMDFYKTFYVPNNATLTLVGDIKIDQAKEWVKKYYGDIPKGTKEIPRPNVQEPPLGAEIIDSVFDKVQLPMITHTYRIPSETNADVQAIDMLMMVLGNGENSRLNKRLIDKENKSVQVFAYARPMEDAGIANITALASLGVTPATIDLLLDEEVERVKKELISEEEYLALINKIENQMVSRKASVASIAEDLANSYVYNKGNTNLINTELELYKKVTREDIKRVANTYLQKNNRVNLRVLPKK